MAERGIAGPDGTEPDGRDPGVSGSGRKPGLIVLACGSRDWDDAVCIGEFMARLPPGTVVIHGDCRGADLLADAQAVRAGFRTVPVPAEWDVYGMRAGPVRNSKMLRMLLTAREGGVRVGVAAFHDDPRLGVGTRDMVKKSLKSAVPVLIHTHVDGIVIP